MKHVEPFSLFAFILSFLIASQEAVNAQVACTHGMLYVSDNDTTTIHIFDLDNDLDELTETATITGLQGEAGQAVDTTNSGVYVMSTYWGSEDNNYLDAFVNFIDTGASKAVHDGMYNLTQETPKVLKNAYLDCGPVWNVVGHAGHIGLFCDGFMEDNINSTFYVLDESLLGEDVNPFLYNMTLQGTQHGLAIPMDATHVFHSIANIDRINGAINATELPETFQLVDSEGTLIHNLTDTSDPLSHCHEYHGSSAINNDIYLCCHENLLLVEFDPATLDYSSRILTYPDTISDAHRCASVTTTEKSGYVVSDYADWYSDVYAPHLLAFPKGATEISDADVLVFGDAGQCYYEFEQSKGEQIVTLLPNGTAQVYSYGSPDGWKLDAETNFENVASCEDVMLVVGYMQFFVAIPSTKTLYAVEMDHAVHGELEVSSIVLPFTPFDMAVAGVPEDLGCADSHDDDGSHDDGASPNGEGSAAELSYAPIRKTASSIVVLVVTFLIASI